MQRGEGTTRGRRQYKNVGSRGGKFSNNPRTLSNIRSSKRVEDTDNQELLQRVIDKVETPSASRMQKKNPTRENPKPDDPSVKLEQYVGEWIDTDRNNIQVELRNRFEDRMIEEHIKYIVVDSDALQYEDKRDVETMVLAWTAYAYCNIAYRLIITLPSSNRVEASDFLRELHDSDQPRNTPAFSEMLTHLGKSDVPHYGRLRIDGPLLQAKRRVARAVYLLKDEKPWADEFIFERDSTGDQLDEWENGIWDDRDSWDWLRKRAVDFINLELVKHRSFDDIRDEIGNTGLKFMFSLPHVEVKERNEKGLRNIYKPAEVIAYWTMIRFLKKEQIDMIMAAFILISIPFEFFKTMDKPLEEWSNDWKKENFEYSDATMHDLLEYVGIPRLEGVMSFRTLRYNYFVIVNNYNSSVRARLERIFDMSTVSKEEFGDEAQAIQCVEPDDRSNPYLQSSFMFDNKQKIAAGGIFNYAFRVRHKLAQEMMMKRTRPSMIAEIVSKFGKGKK